MTADSTRRQRVGPEAALAMEMVSEAIHIVRAVEHEASAGALSKSDASPVTIADFSVQAFVAARLSREFPDDVLVAEEDASALRQQDAASLARRVVDFVQQADATIRPDRVLEWIDRGGGSPGRRFWTLDPVDGTKGLLRGGQYVVALALIEDGVVQIGVLGCPHLFLGDGSALGTSGAGGEGGTAAAVRGRGAWWSSLSGGSLIRLTVSANADPRRARVLHSFEAPHSDVARFRRVLTMLGVSGPPVLMDSQAKHAVLASGGADLLLRFPLQKDSHDAIWDQAAGSLLMEEAGGRVTDLTGRALDFSTGRRLLRNTGLVASNGHLHDAALAALRHSDAEEVERPTPHSPR
jgi:3'(2'), 5'-bisphosphate nucleotidase